MAAGQAPDRMWLLPPNADTVTAGVLTVTGVTTGTSQPIFDQAQGIVTFWFRSIGVTSGGTILIEEADWGPNEHPYSGTWSQVQSIAASSFSGGAQLAVHISVCSYRYLRVRISSPITGGGSITVSRSALGAM